MRSYGPLRYMLVTPSLSRHADDADLNAVQKEEMRWNDPAAAFLLVRPPWMVTQAMTNHLSCTG